ncbi:MAG: PAS domain S-box protein [Sphingobacteriaceae bacterium]
MESLALNSGENDLSEMISQAPVAIGIIRGREMIIESANAFLLELLGRSAQIIGLPLLKAIPEMAGEAFPNFILKVLETGVAYHDNETHVDILRNNQLEFGYFNFVFSVLRDEKLNTSGVLIVANEVTDLVKAKLSFQQQSGIKYLVMDTPVPTAIFLGKDMVVQFANDAVSKLLQKDITISHQPLREALPELAGQPFLQSLEAVFDSGIVYHSEEQKITLSINGHLKPLYFNFTIKPLRNSDNKIYGILCMAIDITHLIQTRQQLAVAEERTRFALEAAEMGTWVMYPLEGTVESDERCKSLFGLLKTDEPSKTFGDVFKYIHPDDLALVQQASARATDPNGASSYEIEFRIFTQDNDLRWLRCKGKAYFNNGGIAYLVAGTVLDITEEKRKDTALRNEEKRFHTAFENAAVGMVILDLDANIQQTNTVFSNIIGYTEEELHQLNFKDITFPEDIELHQQMIEKLLKQEIPSFVIQKRYIKKDGTLLWAKLSSALFYKENGAPDSYISAIQDITQEIRAIEKLNSTNDELSDLVKQFTFVTDFMPQIVWATMPDGSQDFFNRRWYSYTGRTTDETKRNGWLGVLYPDDQRESEKLWNKSLETGRPYEREYRMRRHDGVYRWFLTRALPLRDESGVILRWFGTCTDIHEQKQLEQQKDNFLGIASHELKTPVTSIKAYAQVLESMLRKTGALKEADMVLKMDLQINRLTNLIGDLLDVTRINSGRLPFNRTTFDFNQLASEIIEELQRTTGKHVITEHFLFTGHIYADRERVGQVITNLLTNAIKYSPNANEVIVHTRLQDQMVTLSVEDFGVGIPEEYRYKVFEQFYRVTESKQHTFSGIGLGLYISSEIINREGGKIWIDKSIEGKGSTFCIALPVDEDKLKDLL